MKVKSFLSPSGLFISALITFILFLFGYKEFVTLGLTQTQGFFLCLGMGVMVGVLHALTFDRVMRNQNPEYDMKTTIREQILISAPKMIIIFIFIGVVSGRFNDGSDFIRIILITTAVTVVITALEGYLLHRAKQKKQRLSTNDKE